jgi:succinoglycan biosynthesis protein ExoM
MPESPMSSAHAASAEPRVAIAVCTYRRLDSLLRTLTHCARTARHTGRTVKIVVVDNDGSDPAVESAIKALSAREHLEIHAVVESTPGISAARNAAFAKALDLGTELLAMLDDDEWPSEAWLTELLRAQSATSAAVVGGPVRPVFPDSAERLKPYARYWSVQHQTLKGKPFVFCSCNFLIDLRAIDGEPRPLFDDAFGLSGGGDTVFFRKLFTHGHPMAWAETAVVFEEVPESRASFKWMRQRRYRVGNHAVRWESIDSSLQSFLKTLGLCVRLFFYPLFRREPESPWVGWLLEFDKVRGRIAAHFGNVFMEYARPAPNTAERICR